MVAFAGFASTACALRSIRAGHADDQLNRSTAREGVRDRKGRRWEPILGLASLKAELERRKELGAPDQNWSDGLWRSDRYGRAMGSGSILGRCSN